MLSYDEKRKVWAKFLFWDITRRLKGNSELIYYEDIDEYSIKIFYNKRRITFMIDEILTDYIKKKRTYSEIFFYY